MKKFSLTLCAIIVVLLIAGCATAQSDLPEWVIDPPVAEDALYGVGYAQMSNPAQSLKIATTRARADIASQIESTIQSATVDYMQEAGVDNENQVISFVESITREIVNNKISNTRREKTYEDRDGGWWVLVSYNTNAFTNDFVETAKEFIRNESSAYAEFKADQAIEALENQLKNNPPVSNPVTR